MRGQVTVGDAAAEHAQVLLVARAAHVEDRHAVRRCGRRELRVVVEELVQAVDDVHPAAHRVEHDAALVRREHAAGGRHPEDEEVGDAARQRDRVREVGADRDPVRRVVEHRAGVEPGLRAVDHREDLVLLGVAHQAVGGLAVDGAEVRFAVDDGRGAHHDDPPGSGRLPPSKRGVRCRSPETSRPVAEGRRRPRAEQARPAGDRGRLAADPQPRALVERQHRAVVLLEELLDPLLAGLAHEGRRRVGVDVVEVDLERHQAERREARRPADRHVVGGADGRAGDVGAGGGAHVAGRALAHASAQLVDHAEA